jgi:hypothetical protein
MCEGDRSKPAHACDVLPPKLSCFGGWVIGIARDVIANTKSTICAAPSD